MKVVIEFADKPTVAYTEGRVLTAEELAQVMAVMLNDTLGPDPQIGDVLKLQMAIQGALKD